MNQPVFINATDRATPARKFVNKVEHIALKSTNPLFSPRFWGFLLAFALMWSFVMSINVAEAAEKRIVILGDSLTAGYGLQGGQAFPDQLQIALEKEGLDVQVDNAGVSGDTTAGGLSRLNWAIQGDQTPDLVIVALGANDMLRALPVTDSRKNLSTILKTLKDKNIQTLLVGMKVPGQYAMLFRTKFEDMYTNLADEYDVSFYPFFLEGVALDPKLNQPDGIHPNEKGVAIMVKNMTPVVKDLLEK